MRALIIFLTDQPGGAERIACLVANNLARRNDWEVEVAIAARELPGGFTSYALSPLVRRTFGPFARERFSLAHLALRIVGRRYDLVFTTHVHTNALTSTLRAAKFMSTKKLVSRESTTIFDRYTGIKRLIFRALYRLYGSQDLIIAQTRYMAKHIAPYVSARAGKNIQTIPNPIDIVAIEEDAERTLPEAISRVLIDNNNILFCGRLVEVKQPTLAIDAYVRLMDKLPNKDKPRLVFMGDGPLRPALEAAAQEAGLGVNDVIFLGRQANPYAVMRRCRYGLLTSSREGFPNVVLEMMASGVHKIVVTPCAGDLDTLTGVTVTADFQAETLALALRNAILDHHDYREYYKEAVSARSIDHFVDKLIYSFKQSAYQAAGTRL